MRNADCVVLIFDVLRTSSWQYIEKWIEEQYPQIKPEPLVAVCANKCDCEETFDTKLIETQLKNGYENLNNLIFYKTSALTGNNIANLFNTISQKLDSMLKKGLCATKGTQPQKSSEKGCC